MCHLGYACICVHLLFIMQHCSVPVQCLNSTRGSKPYAAKATFGDSETSLKTVEAEQHEVSSTFNGSDAEEENASNSPVLAIMTKTVDQHITLPPSPKIMQTKTEKQKHTTLPPSPKIMQTKTEKQITLKTEKRLVVASTRTSITTRVPATTTTAPTVGRVTSTPQAKKEAKAATSTAVVGAGTEPKQDRQVVSTEGTDEEGEEEPEENNEDTIFPVGIARSTIASHLDEKHATVSTTHFSLNERDDSKGESHDSGRDVQSPDSKGPAGTHKKKANVGAAVLLVCGIILSLLLSILVVLISMMISAQRNPRLRSTMQSAGASSAAV